MGGGIDNILIYLCLNFNVQRKTYRRLESTEIIRESRLYTILFVSSAVMSVRRKFEGVKVFQKATFKVLSRRLKRMPKTKTEKLAKLLTVFVLI